MIRLSEVIVVEGLVAADPKRPPLALSSKRPDKEAPEDALWPNMDLAKSPPEVLALDELVAPDAKRPPGAEPANGDDPQEF